MPKKPSCIGKTFLVGSYLVTVEDVIAEGGFAIVFLTRDQMGRRYALKRMYVNTEQDVVMCQQEISILEELGKLADSYIVRYFDSVINDVDEEVKEVLILLEYYKNSVLQLMNDRFQGKRYLTEDEVLRIFADVCHSVGKLHTHRPSWTHRDLKVENILIDKDGRCVLCDFGSCTSRVLDPLKQSITEIEEELKKYTTIAYRAPEMVNLYGLKKPITTKADIWALGVLLYKICYFTLPFGESSLAIQNCNLQFPSHPAYSKQLTGLIRYCLRVNPEERPEIYQVSSLTCALISRECLVPNVNRCPPVTPDILLSLPELNQTVPVAFLETSPPRNIRASAQSTQEFSSTTSIAPRERPKASTPAAGLVLLPSIGLKMATDPASKDGLLKNFTSSSRPGNFLVGEMSHTAAVVNGQSAVTPLSSPFKPVVPGTGNPFRDDPKLAHPLPNSLGGALPRPERPSRIGHRRNTSDTSMVPAPRPLSPTLTQNISEKSRSADTSPTRSPHAHPSGSDIDRKFSGWNPFDDAEIWAHVPPPPSTAASLAHSLSSLVRGGSISSASRTTVVSPTENGSKGRSGKGSAGTGDLKKEKKKFRYQKFDNDSEEELMPAGGDDLLDDNPVQKKSGDKSAMGSEKPTKDKDTDSIGSASDLKHEDDTTDEDRDIESGDVVKVRLDQDKTEEEDNGAYDSVQYGTLEETASAIQSVVSHKSILQDSSSKPLIDNGFDKSDDDELDRTGPVLAFPTQRRLTFDSMGLLSVFDQIPFRYPKKSKTFSAGLKSSDSFGGADSSFAETNPFSSHYVESTPTTSLETLHNFKDIAGRYHSNVSDPPVKLPPPVPPKPLFLRKESNGNSSLTCTTNWTPKEHGDVFGSFDSADTLNHSLINTSHQRRDSATHGVGKTPRRDQHSPEGVPLFTSHSVGPSESPKLSKSPTTRRSRVIQEGISNISFEDV